MKGKEEASERVLTEKEASQLSDTEFKKLVIRKPNELTENYQKLRETTMNTKKPWTTGFPRKILQSI